MADSYPEPLSAIDTTSYAYSTVQHRMPIILTKVVDHLSRHKSEVYEAKDSATSTNAIKKDGLQEQWNNSRHESEEELKGILGALAKLRNELQTNKIITQFDLTKAVKDESCMGDFAEWNSACSSWSARNLSNISEPPRWFQSPWLFVECYMHRRIMAAIHETTHLRLLDPFKWQKAESLKDATQDVHSMLDYLNDTLEKIAQTQDKSSDELKNHFENLLRLSLWGNKGDLSHNAGKEKVEEISHAPHDQQKKMKEVLIVDDSEAVWLHLKNASNSGNNNVRVDIVCDNYGLEVVADLIFGEFLVVSGLASQVCYHVKAMPWFVSDTTVPDFLRILDIINDHGGKFGEKWRNYLIEGKFILTTDFFWTLPFDFNLMPEKAPALYDYFKDSTLIVFKGDLNYRKLVGDLKWPETTPFRTAIRNFHPAPFCSLRGLKAEVVVGLRDGQVEELQQQEKDWLFSGNFAVIQFLDSS